MFIVFKPSWGSPISFTLDTLYLLYLMPFPPENILHFTFKIYSLFDHFHHSTVTIFVQAVMICQEYDYAFVASLVSPLLSGWTQLSLKSFHLCLYIFQLFCWVGFWE
jgi:hypothetical protein